MIAGNQMDRHRETFKQLLIFLPFTFNCIEITRVTLDHIADTHHKIGSEPLDLVDYRTVDTRLMTAGSIANHGKSYSECPGPGCRSRTCPQVSRN